MENNVNKKYVDLSTYTDTNDLHSLDRVVFELIKAKFKGDLVSYNYNDHMFYSDSVTLDNAYLEYYDMTKEEYTYYVRNVYAVMREILLSSFNDMVIDPAKYIEYKESVLIAPTPDILQTHHLLFRALNDLYVGMSESTAIDRFKQIKENRKEYAYKYIDKYFKSTFKDYSVELLELQRYSRIRENNK
jgi:hypothetical protein